jgi:hypothetical protein
MFPATTHAHQTPAPPPFSCVEIRPEISGNPVRLSKSRDAGQFGFVHLEATANEISMVESHVPCLGLWTVSNAALPLWPRATLGP